MGAAVVVRWVNNMTRLAPHHAGRAGVPDAGRRGAPRRRRCSTPEEQRDLAAKVPNPIKPTEASLAVGTRALPDVLRALPRAGGQGGRDRARGGQVHPAA